MFDPVKWKEDALNKQGDLILKVIQGMLVSKHQRADISSIDKALVKLGHDMTRNQIKAGAWNALERGLLDKEGFDRFFLPVAGQPRHYKMKVKRVAS